MKKTIIIYGSTTGNTSTAAETLASKLDGAVLKEVSSASASDLAEYDNIFLGTSTWGCGELQDDFQSFIGTVGSASLAGKNVAIFGVGDQFSYSDTYCNGMGEIYEAAKGTGANIIGATSTDGYSFMESTAVVDGKFVGLALDYDNQADKSEERISAWINGIKDLL